MAKTGGWLVNYALEQVGVKYTFGIPGVHNTEIYDELNKSELITPYLVTHEGGASFMADAIGRTTGQPAALVIVPAAGTTHAASGIGEAYLDGSPMLIISATVRRDSGRAYQLHAIDHEKLSDGMVKKYILADTFDKIIPAIYEAYDLSVSGCPGPVFVDIPAELLLFSSDVDNVPAYKSTIKTPELDHQTIKAMAKEIVEAKNPGLFLGWGARNCQELTEKLADLVQMPISTSLQGTSVISHDHPLHAGYGFSVAAVPAAEKAFSNCDCLLAVGVRFAELATQSYGLNVPANLLHIDIDSDVFDKNYPTNHKLQADATEAMTILLAEVESLISEKRNNGELKGMIKEEKMLYSKEWDEHDSKDKVNPNAFYKSLRTKLERDAYVVVDDGNHTFLTAELMKTYHSKHLISPTDFNAMGFCVPAAIGTKISHSDKQVVGIVGDGCLLMTGMELLTASANNLGVVIFVFSDGELAQISQFQQTPMNRKTCTVLPAYKVEGIAIATGAEYIEMADNASVDSVIDKALATASEGRPVLVDIKIDYSKKSRFTKGVVKTNLSRFPMGQKVRVISRALKRHVLG